MWAKRLSNIDHSQNLGCHRKWTYEGWCNIYCLSSCSSLSRKHHRIQKNGLDGNFYATILKYHKKRANTLRMISIIVEQEIVMNITNKVKIIKVLLLWLRLNFQLLKISLATEQIQLNNSKGSGALWHQQWIKHWPLDQFCTIWLVFTCQMLLGFKLLYII